MKSPACPPFKSAQRPAVAAASLALISSLIGCGMAGSSISSTGITTSSAALKVAGNVHGGQQPVTGATIQLYTAGAVTPVTGTTPVTGYGSGATPFGASVTTDINGDFALNGTYTCPTPAAQVYIVATGGNPGNSPAANNNDIALMAALGTCPAGGSFLTTTSYIAINEVTTVSAVWGLQQFMAAPATGNTGKPNIGAPNTAYASGTTLGSIQSGLIGLNNAFTTAKVMADTTNGNTPNTNYAYATPESAKINTIADILAYCVNSNPATSTNCSNMLAAATPSGKFAAADTIQAAWYMAQNPINNLSTLYSYVSSTAPFQPTYLAPGTLNTGNTAPATNAFNDTTIAINYAPTVSSTAAVSAPYNVAIDAFGNAWISNAGGIGGLAASAEELGADGSALIAPATTYTASATNGSTGQFTIAPTSNTRTFSAPKGVAIDLANRAWIANESDAYAATATQTTGSVAVFTGSTTTGTGGGHGGIGSTGFYVGDLPFGIAVDGTNNVFVINSASAGTSVLDGSSLASLVSAPGSASDGTYTYSTSSATAAPNRTQGGGSEFVAIDANANATGGIVWVNDSNACKVQGQFNAASGTYFGEVNQFAGSTLAPLSGSDAVTSYSNATVGAGSTTNCNSTGTYVGQVYSAPSANIFNLAIDRNNGVWLSDVYTSSSGFDGLTYLAAPTASTGISPASYYLVNGTLPTQTTGSAVGTTLDKTGAVAVDGNNNVWIGSQSGKSVAEATLSGTAITLLTPGQGSVYGSTGAANGIGFVHNTSAATGLAIDASGNVWIANNDTKTADAYTNAAGSTTAYIGNSVTVVVGAAGPVITPQALAIKANKIATKP
jgi:hypothetical protein